MSLTPEDKVLVVQRFVNSFATDLTTVHAALGDPGTPEPAQRQLIGGLNYALDKLDMFPDHLGGIGMADDAIVLRISAKLARAAGAKHAGLEPLALDANNVINLFPDLAEPLEKFVATFHKREVRGRSTDKILTQNLVRAAFDGDIQKEVKSYKAQKIGTTADAPKVVDDLYKRLKEALKKARLM